MDFLSIEELVARAQAGDGEAFAELVDRHYAMVHGLALSRTADWDDASDVSQDVFIVAWAGLGRLKHPRAFSMWLRRIARNMAIDWRRHNRQRLQRSAPPVDAESPDDFPVIDDPAVAASRRECLETLCATLGILSPKLREAMVLYYLEGNTMAEAAKALGITEEAMKKRVQMGCARLKEHYDRQHRSDLEPLLPYSPQPYRQKIMAGLAVGSTLPLAKPVSSSGPAMIVHHLLYGGSVSALKEAGLLSVCLGWTAAGLCVLGGLVASAAIVGMKAGLCRGNDGEAAVSAPTSEGIGLFLVAVKDHPEYGLCLVVLSVVPGSGAGIAGIRPGDCIVRINGRALRGGDGSEALQELRRLRGTDIGVRVARTRRDAPTEYLDLVIPRPSSPTTGQTHTAHP